MTSPDLPGSAGDGAPDRAWTANPVAVPEDLDPGLTGAPSRPVEGIDNGFMAGYRVRFDEAGPDGQARASALLRYAQDIAWRHSEDRGFDRTWYAERGRWWVVRALELEVHRPIPMGRTIRLATAVVGHRRIWARRLGEARTVAGELAATIQTDWVILDDRGRLIRIPPEFGTAFPNPEVADEILRVPVGAEPSLAHVHPIAVSPAHLDPMGHVNNAVYLDWIDEAVESGGLGEPSTAPRRVRLEYLASAGPRDHVVVRCWRDGAGWSARVVRATDSLELVRASGSEG